MAKRGKNTTEIYVANKNSTVECGPYWKPLHRGNDLNLTIAL